MQGYRLKPDPDRLPADPMYTDLRIRSEGMPLWQQIIKSKKVYKK